MDENALSLSGFIYVSFPMRLMKHKSGIYNIQNYMNFIKDGKPDICHICTNINVFL